MEVELELRALPKVPTQICVQVEDLYRRPVVQVRPLVRSLEVVDAIGGWRRQYGRCVTSERSDHGETNGYGGI